MQQPRARTDLFSFPGSDTPASGTPRTRSVTQITAMVKQAIESALPPTVHVVGQVSNFKRHSSGHLYFTLKDDACELSCVMWRSSAGGLKFDPSDGQEVVATGRVELFERAGRYQLYARKLEPRGIGALELAFRQMCEKLKAEGLFEDEHKQPLPEIPSTVALITSETGAAVADMMRTLHRRFPPVRILVYPVRVQGEGAADQIANAIKRIDDQADALGGVDIVIVGRGGGSLEDLWAFNEEVVARAIFGCSIPVISAVGHEVDITVSDLVADVRAATPTAAAELAVPVLEDLLAEVSGLQQRMSRSTSGLVQLSRARLDGVLRHSMFREPLLIIQRREQLIDELIDRMDRRLMQKVSVPRRRLDQIVNTMQRIAPHTALMRASLAFARAEARLQAATAGTTGSATRRLDTMADRLSRVSPQHRLPALVGQVDRAHDALHAGAKRTFKRLTARVEALEGMLLAMSYKSVLHRGYSITRVKRTRDVVRQVDDLRDGMRIITELSDGAIDSVIVNLTQLELFE